jgi:RNA polymerase sigma-70 factor (ECF subfamily)
MTVVAPLSTQPHPDPDGKLLLVPGEEAHEAFEIVFRRHVGAVRAYLAARVGRDRADDLVSDTFAAAWQSRRRFDPSTSNARPWLLGIATNVLRRDFAAEDRWQTSIRNSSSFAEQSAVDTYLADDLSQPLLRALARLSTTDRALLLLCSIGQISAVEAGRVLGISSGAARIRMHRARKRMATEMHRRGIDT